MLILLLESVFNKFIVIYLIFVYYKIILKFYVIYLDIVINLELIKKKDKNNYSYKN